MEFVLVALIVFVGIVTQSMIGFGVALISMPLLIRILSPTEAAAFMALLGLPLQILILRRYRQSLNIRPLWRVLVGSLIGIPVGIFLIAQLDPNTVLGLLGILLIVYALYSLFNLRPPRINRPEWGFGYGFFSGVFGGAYNTAGPPLVIYGTALGWTSQQFKANMQILFLIGNLVVITVHIASGHVDTRVMQNLLVSLPVLLVGTSLGFWLSHRVNEALFRKLVLFALLLIGIRLLLP
jgi:uncharacterized membrane protein YfcA